MSQLSDIFARHARYQDAMTSAFTEHLHEIVLRAQASVVGKLQGKLAITDGVIDNTPGNARAMRQIGKALQGAMDKAGYQRLVNAFTSELPGQMPFLNDIVDWIGQQTKTAFPPMGFTAQNLNVLTAMAANSAATLESVMDNAATTAMSRGLFSVGGLKFSDLIETIADKLGNSIPQATTVADTSMSVFFRTMTEQRFDAIQKDLPGVEMRYKYNGPDDKVTRPFCHAVLGGRGIDRIDGKQYLFAPKSEGGSYTRAQIDTMQNGSLPNVYISCGSWNCRHLWLLDTDFAMEAFKRAA